MRSVAIISRKEVWSTGLAALVERWGFDLSGRWQSADAALAGLKDRLPRIIFLDTEASKDASFARVNLNGTAIILTIDPHTKHTGELDCRVPITGLLESTAGPETIEQCLDSVMGGRVWIDPEICHSVETETHSPASWDCLTERQLQVANLAARGLSNKRIARLLDVSHGTVKIHMHNIFAKLHLSHRDQLTNLPSAAQVDDSSS